MEQDRGQVQAATAKATLRGAAHFPGRRWHFFIGTADCELCLGVDVLDHQKFPVISDYLSNRNSR